MSYGELLGTKKFSFCTSIGTGDGDTDLVAAPASGTLYLQHLTIAITTAAAQAFRIEDKGATPKVFFSGPASLAVGNYYVPMGPLGVATSEAAVALEYDCAAAGVGCTISGWGYTA